VNTRRVISILTSCLLLAAAGISSGQCETDEPDICDDEAAADSVEVLTEDTESDSTACGEGDPSCCMPELPPLPEPWETPDDEPEETS